jgi:hypothetical protein
VGNDLLIATLAIETGKTPDFDAARTRVRGMGDDDLAAALENHRGDYELDDDGNLDRAKAIKELLAVVDGVSEATMTEHRHLYETPYIVPGWTVWITGGDSWGDSPSEEFDLFNTFLGAGYPGETLAQAAGFAHRFVDPAELSQDPEKTVPS